MSRERAIVNPWRAHDVNQWLAAELASRKAPDVTPRRSRISRTEVTDPATSDVQEAQASNIEGEPFPKPSSRMGRDVVTAIRKRFTGPEVVHHAIDIVGQQSIEAELPLSNNGQNLQK